MTTLQPWQQQPNETAKAFDAFKIYRDLPPSKRSLSAVVAIIAQNKGHKKGTKEVVINGHYSRWQQGNNWVARAKAHDAHLDAIELAAFEEERIKDAIKRLAQWKTLRSKMVEKLETVGADDIDVNQLLKGLQLANDQIRLELGEEDGKPEVQVNIQNNQLLTNFDEMAEEIYGDELATKPTNPS